VWQQLAKDTKDGDVAEKMVVYNHANKEVNWDEEIGSVF
jgi:hypothetical protein